MRFYVDSSVALHALLPWGDSAAVAWFDGIGGGGELYSSALLELEIARVLRREGLVLEAGRPVLDRVSLVSLDNGVLRAAAQIEPHAKTLDSIHLATSLLLGPGITIATHDQTMRRAAGLLGLAVTDPLDKP